mmetsp:Transcript_26835/g.37449  ORF Transcript_26835/g.37449 Transcript_26835/m.37449 type:complete len:339 (-) Transcript_26835:119-1135(-)
MGKSMVSLAMAACLATTASGSWQPANTGIKQATIELIPASELRSRSVQVNSTSPAEQQQVQGGGEEPMVCKVIGDPHITPFGGSKFDYTACGEFLLSSFPGDSGESGARLGSCVDKVANAKGVVSFVTSAAFKCGMGVVIVQAEPAENGSPVVRFYLDERGELTALGSQIPPESFDPNCGTIDSTENSLTCSCIANEVTLMVRQRRFFLDLEISSPPFPGLVEGLCHSMPGYSKGEEKAKAAVLASDSSSSSSSSVACPKMSNRFWKLMERNSEERETPKFYDEWKNCDKAAKLSKESTGMSFDLIDRASQIDSTIDPCICPDAVEMIDASSLILGRN